MQYTATLNAVKFKTFQLKNDSFHIFAPRHRLWVQTARRFLQVPTINVLRKKMKIRKISNKFSILTVEKKSLYTACFHNVLFTNYNTLILVCVQALS